jgi:hypothetical protein
MTASKVNPNMWKGEERSGGVIGKNNKPNSASSPDFKGRLYLQGVGWYWLSGWIRGDGEGEFLSLRAQEMTDDQAEKYCKPKPETREKPRSAQHNSAQQHHVANGADATEGEIPF